MRRNLGFLYKVSKAVARQVGCRAEDWVMCCPYSNEEFEADMAGIIARRYAEEVRNVVGKMSPQKLGEICWYSTQFPGGRTTINKVQPHTNWAQTGLEGPELIQRLAVATILAAMTDIVGSVWKQAHPHTA